MLTDRLAAYLRSKPGYCPECLFHLAAQGCHCETGEWSTFVRAIKQAADNRGNVSQTRVRPLIQSIPHKHRGSLYRRAVADGLIRPAGWEPSTDSRGRNTDKQQRTYLLAA